MLQNAFASIMGALILTAVIYLLKVQIIPRARAILSDEVRLEGSWSCNFVSPSGNPHFLKMNLKQKHRDLRARILVIKKIGGTGETEIKIYTGHGELRNGTVVLYAHNVDRRTFGAHTELLKIEGDGRTMSGLGSWHSITTNDLQSTKFEWHRTKEDILSQVPA
jgi:hypothetical protein